MSRPTPVPAAAATSIQDIVNEYFRMYDQSRRRFFSECLRARVTFRR